MILGFRMSQQALATAVLVEVSGLSDAGLPNVGVACTKQGFRMP